MRKIRIIRVEFLYYSQPKRRKIKCVLSNGHKVYIQSSYEAWMQWGGTTEDLYVTQPIAEEFNAWLHGEDL